MRCALLFYFGVTTFAIVYSLPPELCVFVDYGEKGALCGIDDVEYTFDFIPPISQYVTFIDLRGQPLEQLPYNGFRNISSQSSLSEIWIQACHISHVDAGAFLNLHNLSLINLSLNDINQIDIKWFSDTKQIKVINMEYNKIEVLPNGIFQNLVLLEEVDLHGNQIRQVEWYSFENTPSLWMIDLRNNQIEFMDMLFKDKFDNLTSLWLYGNPWKCNCELGPLYEFLIKINQSNRYAPVCDKPSALHGGNWNDISRDIFLCRSEVTMSAQATVYNGTRNQQINTGMLQPPSNLNWIPYTILALMLMCVAAAIIGVVFAVRYKNNFVKQGSDRRTNARNMDRGIPMRVVHSSAVSENNDSSSSTDDVDEEQISIHRYELRVVTTN